MLKQTCLATALGLGVAGGANGLFMLVAPDAWYALVPGVATTGPFNQHFIRDIGLVYLQLSAALVLGAARHEMRALLWSAAAIWLTGHALFHVWEVIAGICGPAALVRDFGAVTLPAVVIALMALWAVREDDRAVTH